MKIRNIILTLLPFMQSLFITVPAKQTGSIIMNELNLNWQFRQSGTEKWLPAKVPGCVHTDLLDNGVIKDPFFRMNEKELQWIDKVDWEYATIFNADAAFLENKKIEMEFKGLDTYAEVFINEVKILKAQTICSANGELIAKNFLNRDRTVCEYFFTHPLRLTGRNLKTLAISCPHQMTRVKTGKWEMIR